MNRDFKGVWIPKEIWLDENMTWIEKLFITEINSLDNENGCFASNNYFAEFFKITPGRCSQIIKSLKKKEYISCKYDRNGKEIKKRVLKILNTGIKNIKQGYLENAKGINTSYNNTILLSLDDTKDNNTPILKTKKQRKYTDEQLLKRDELVTLFKNTYKSNIKNNLELYINKTEWKSIYSLLKFDMNEIKIKLKELVYLSKNEPKYWKILPSFLENKWNHLSDVKDQYDN